MSPVDISLYAILDPRRTRDRGLAEMAAAAAKGGATLLQYRDKDADTRTLISNARTIKAALEPFDAPLLINDRVDVALAAGADGVHVGQSDMTPADARALLGPEAIVGLTIKTETHARVAPLHLLDYACIGGIYATLSKDNPTAIGLDGWRAIDRVFDDRDATFPVGGIAGIDETNVADVITTGADGAAIISAIFMADEVEAATRNLKSIIEESRL